MGVGQTGVDFPIEAWITVVNMSDPGAPGKLGMLTAAVKQVTAMWLLTVQVAVSRTGALAYIEPVLWFLLRLPIRKRPVLRTGGDARPIAMEEETAKIVAVMIIAQTEQYVSDTRWASQKGLLAGDVARMLTLLLDHTCKQHSKVARKKRDRRNVYGKVNPSGLAHLLQEAGVDAAQRAGTNHT